MTLTTTERAQVVARYLAKSGGITQAQVGARMGYSNKSAFSAVLNGLKPMPAKFCEKLAALDPAINPDFLSGASDEMLRPVPGSPAPAPASAGVFIPSELVQMFSDLAATIRSQQETIRTLTERRPSVEKGDAAASF